MSKIDNISSINYFCSWFAGLARTGVARPLAAGSVGVARGIGARAVVGAGYSAARKPALAPPAGVRLAWLCRVMYGVLAVAAMGCRSMRAAANRPVFRPPPVGRVGIWQRV